SDLPAPVRGTELPALLRNVDRGEFVRLRMMMFLAENGLSERFHPFAQCGIAPAGLQGLCSGPSDRKHVVAWNIDLQVKAGAPVTVAAVCFHPISRIEFRPVAVDLIAALLADDPFAV